MQTIIDAHIHLDHYKKEEIEPILHTDLTVAALIGVSFDLASCRRNLELSQQYNKLKPAFGWHPEQELITDTDFTELIDWMTVHEQEMIAVGEVGLPYYLRKKESLPIEGYLECLETFIILAKKWQKPIVLHAVYDDTPLVCALLEKHSVESAHFHWFKGDPKTITRMIDNGYFISVTPDVLYEKEIQQLVQQYPLEGMMVETDGPWPFEGPFQDKLTHPSMIHHSIQMIANIKKRSVNDVYQQLYKNTMEFYQLS
jgi:TatD DNase family protein